MKAYTPYRPRRSWRRGWESRLWEMMTMMNNQEIFELMTEADIRPGGRLSKHEWMELPDRLREWLLETDNVYPAYDPYPGDSPVFARIADDLMDSYHAWLYGQSTENTCWQDLLHADEEVDN